MAHRKFQCNFSGYGMDSACYHARRVVNCLSQAQAADWLGVNVKTVKRWESGAAPMPRAAWLALMGRAGFLGAVDAQWDGWRVFRGELYAPNGYHFTPGEIAGVPLLYAQLSDAERRARQAGQGNQSAPQTADNVAPIRRRV